MDDPARLKPYKILSHHSLKLPSTLFDLIPFLHNHNQYPLISCSVVNVRTTLNNQASAMLEGRAVVGESDMLQKMQQDALHLAAKALDSFDVTQPTEIARFIKKEFDRVYGPGWQCIVGTDFGSFVTHCFGCFIHFQIGSLAILLFRGSAVPEEPTADNDDFEVES